MKVKKHEEEIRKNNISGADLAWIIHGVVIAEGFLKLSEADLFGFILLVIILIIAVVDWHKFYKIYNKLNYSIQLWVCDYILLALLAISITKATNQIHRDCIFWCVFILWIIGIGLWWFFIPDSKKRRKKYETFYSDSNTA